MKKSIAILSLLFLTGCISFHPSHFYVKSFNDGYRVCVSTGDIVCFSKPYSDPIHAKILTEELNRDMEGNWEK